MLSLTLASAQEKSARKNPGQANSSSAATKSRTRRVSTKAPDETSSSSTENEVKPTVTINAKGEPTVNGASGRPRKNLLKPDDSTSIQQDDIPSRTDVAPDSLISLPIRLGLRRRVRTYSVAVKTVKCSWRGQRNQKRQIALDISRWFFTQGFTMLCRTRSLSQADGAINAYHKAISQREPIPGP